VRLDTGRRRQAVVIGKPVSDRHTEFLSVWLWLANSISVPQRGGNARANSYAV
jgi:hypothetical protein